MPMLKKKNGESEKDYVARCIPDLKEKDPERKQDQIVAMCFSKKNQSKKKLILRN